MFFIVFRTEIICLEGGVEPDVPDEDHILKRVRLGIKFSTLQENIIRRTARCLSDFVDAPHFFSLL